MTERGTVTEIKGKTAVVTVTKSEQCKECGLCLFKKGGKAEFYARNLLDAKVGDDVLLDIKESGRFLGAILVFLVPLLLIGLAVLINFLFIKNDIFIPIISVGSIAVYYTILGLSDKKFRNSRAFVSDITKIIKSEDSDKTDVNV